MIYKIKVNHSCADPKEAIEYLDGLEYFEPNDIRFYDLIDKLPDLGYKIIDNAEDSFSIYEISTDRVLSAKFTFPYPGGSSNRMLYPSLLRVLAIMISHNLDYYHDKDFLEFISKDNVDEKFDI